MLGASAGATSTRLKFTDDSEFSLTQQAVTANAVYRLSPWWSVRGSVGVIAGGSLDGEVGAGAGRTFDIEPGVIASVAVSRSWRLGAGGPWFVTGTASFGAVATQTREVGAMTQDGLVAVDARVGAIAGRTVLGSLHPYVLARGFSGPAMWSVDDTDITGGDTSHFQLGAGASVVVAGALTVVADVSVLGERSASIGASWQL